MARKLPQTRSLKRRPASVQPKMLIVVCCEGRNTEPRYLDEFALANGNKMVRVEPIPAAGAPLTLVKRAIQEKEKRLREASRSGNSFAKAFQVWGVFDIDEHPKIAEAKDLARGNGIDLCISNPCFDLWGLLHFVNQDGYIHRHDAQRRLAEEMPGYEPEKGKFFNYSLMHSRYAQAKSRAEVLMRRREEEDTPGGNPSTDVYRLLDLIIKNGKPIQVSE
ncbi:MAG: RloB family protein [Gallionella sp.]